MPAFDRAAAKAAGWSDQEIEAAIAAGPPTGMAGTRGVPRETLPVAPMGYQGAPDEPLEGDLGLMDPLNLPATIQGGRAIYGLGKAAIEALPAVGKTLVAGGRAVGRRVLGKGNFDDLVKEVGSAGSRTKPAAAPNVTPMKGKVAGKITPAKGTAESRVTKPRPKPAKPPKKNAVGSAESRTRPRGASTPELERRAAARAAATGKNPPAMADDVESQIVRSLEVEDRMKALGYDGFQKEIVRKVMKSNVPDQVSELLRLLGGIGP